VGGTSKWKNRKRSVRRLSRRRSKKKIRLGGGGDEATKLLFFYTITLAVFSEKQFIAPQN
jgi:hypothetical protein